MRLIRGSGEHLMVALIASLLTAGIVISAIAGVFLWREAHSVCGIWPYGSLCRAQPVPATQVMICGPMRLC